MIFIGETPFVFNPEYPSELQHYPAKPGEIGTIIRAHRSDVKDFAGEKIVKIRGK